MFEVSEVTAHRLPSAVDWRPKFQALLDGFFASMTPRTQAAYRQDLADFARFVMAANPVHAARLLLSSGSGSANGMALEYRTRLLEKGLSPATINRRLSALRSLVRLANTLGHVSWSLSIKGVRSQALRDTRGPQLEGFRQLLKAAAAQPRTKAVRDTAILRLLHDLALRRGEVVNLDLENLDLVGNRLFVVGKGRTEPEPLTLPPQTQSALLDWLAMRGFNPGPLFTSLDRARKGTGRLSGSGIHAIVKRLGAKAGLNTRPHALRHSAITTALDQTHGDVRAVQRYSRHKDIRVLTIYDDQRQDLGGKVAAMLAEMVEANKETVPMFAQRRIIANK
jgi:integrase/recombinase XerC